MSAAEKLIQTMSLEEYFQLELTSKERHDFHEGEVYALAGASKNHARIIKRIILTLDPQLEGSSCELFAENVRTEIQVNRTYVYPDIVVDCDGKDDPLQIASPIVLMEVLSPSTEGYDRGFKLRHYLDIPSLQHFVLIAQDEFRAESYSKSHENTWELVVLKNPSDILILKAINAKISLAEIYKEIAFK